MAYNSIHKLMKTVNNYTRVQFSVDVTIDI